LSKPAQLLPQLRDYLDDRLGELGEIPKIRRALLDTLVDLPGFKDPGQRPAPLVFICTHNSRRSQMAQLWALVAARHFSVSGVEAFSGGTEAMAFNPRAVAALRRAGFAIEFFSDGKNPVYEVWYEPEMEPIQAFSKIYDEPPNPTAGFAAVMTCSSADAACPVVPGADARIAIPYNDPKAFDGTEREAEAYDERCAQIAREMLYVFSKIARRK